MNWGTKIVIVFVLFAGLIVTLVTISMKQDVSLVAKDYYVQEIAYQDQIERIKNYKKLGAEQLRITYDDSRSVVVITAPGNHKREGEVHFFRPSDASLDSKYALKPNGDGHQYFDVKNFKKGLWKIKISWQENGREYYEEKTLVI
ncbi:hypothetical protein C900_03362 [Fulvivirga imtechensis AK7]|uniref:Nitrogen fixation protein FixH n=1 Tax=Fulvivirga imtechensis AK7 TaxID=1237149 RepID=L8JTE2_9BACT|nr:FixH family protein [Fulvivirga imtechensis]ELR70754.1 hypothetical protein C900_03362 [Fulvivirga imtechensis AK7]